MFPNETMMKPQTWNDILAAMIDVRDAHGWNAPSRAMLDRRSELDGKKNAQHRPDRLRLHGPGALQRVTAGSTTSSTSPYRARAQGGLRRATRTSVKAFADNWGYESIETDWRKLVERKDIDAIDICTPEQHARRDRHRRGRRPAR